MRGAEARAEQLGLGWRPAAPLRAAEPEAEGGLPAWRPGAGSRVGGGDFPLSVINRDG